MAQAAYTWTQFSADLARFGFKSADELTPRKLAARFRNKDDAADGAARDRLRQWDKDGRPRLLGQVDPHPGFADTAAAAHARAGARQAQLDQQAALNADRGRLDGTARERAQRAEKRAIAGRRLKTLARLPFRLLGRVFVSIPTDFMPWLVMAGLFIFGWPFLQESRLGPYVPHFPSIYAWLNSTDLAKSLRGETGYWVNTPRPKSSTD